MSAMLAFAMVAVLGLGLKVSATTIEETGKAQDVVATSSVDSSRKSTIVAQFNSDFTKTDLRLLGTLEGI